MKIYLVRHGSTEWNLHGLIMGGDVDLPLCPQGFQDVDQMLPALPDDFTIILSGTLQRQVQTAERIADYSGKPYISRDAAFNERRFGILEGKTWEQLKSYVCRDVAERDRRQIYDYHLWGGESANDVRVRLYLCLDSLPRKYPGQTPLVVTSGGILRMLQKPEERKAAIPNCAVMTFQI